MLPSSLTEVRSSTWGEVPLPTGVGLRYGPSRIWLEAFLGGLGPGDFRQLAPARASRHAPRSADLPTDHTPAWQPSLSIRWVHLPYRVPSSLLTMRSGAGLSYLLAIAYDVMSSA